MTIRTQLLAAVAAIALPTFMASAQTTNPPPAPATPPAAGQTATPPTAAATPPANENADEATQQAADAAQPTAPQQAPDAAEQAADAVEADAAAQANAQAQTTPPTAPGATAPAATAPAATQSTTTTTTAQAGAAAPATQADFAAGAMVHDQTGGMVGRIETADATGAVVSTGTVRAKLPLTSFARNAQGLVISMTKAQLEAAVAAQTPAPTPS